MARESTGGTKTKARSTKNPTKGNDTPNTPEVKESEIAQLKVDELRKRLRNRGVKGTAELKKPELVKKLIKLSVDAAAKPSKSSSAAKSGKNPTKGNDTPNTPAVKESEIAQLKVDELRKRLRTRGVKGTAELKKPELVKKLIKLSVDANSGRSTGGKKTATARKASAKSGK